MNDELNLLSNPLFFASARVWRCYLGGKLLDEFLGAAEGADSNFPEDWLASVTLADNGEMQQSPSEGLSCIRGTDLHFADLLRRYPSEAFGTNRVAGTAVLCKFLDSAIRLPIQCHPDREFARHHFGSEYGKSESWLILATREINGEKPYILLGFKPDITSERFRCAVMEQDIATMTACLHKLPVEPGEVYFIPGRIPHAIGPGLLLLEVQEPTDLVIQPERQIGRITLTEKQMWAGLDHDTAFSCFDYRGHTQDEIMAWLKLSPRTKKQWANAKIESVIGAAHTDCFSVDKLTIYGDFEIPCDTPWHIAVVTSGHGSISAADEQPVRRGDSFFVSNRVRKLHYRPAGSEPLELFLISNTAR